MTSRGITTAALAALALGAATQAQDAQVAAQGIKTQPVPGAIVQLPTYHYNAATGKGTFEATPTKIANTQKALSVCYANGTALFSGSFTTLAVGDELVDWGDKSCVRTGQIGSFTFGYATTALDPGMGGPGASIDIAIFQGTTGGGTIGTEIARFSFTGLPGSADGVSVFGASIPVSLLGAEIPVCDGDIGWGYVGVDGLSGPLLMTTTGTCFSTPDPVTGTEDCFDVYATPATGGSYVGTFGFMTPGIGSFWLDLAEHDGASSTSMVINGSGANPMLFSEAATPIMSQPWVTSIDLSGNPLATATAIAFTDSLFPSPVTILAGEVIVDVTAPSWFFNDINIVTPGSHSNTVPKDITLIGNDLYAQGAIFDPSSGGLIMLNAIAFTLGL